jgi:hypothetical protein
MARLALVLDTPGEPLFVLSLRLPLYFLLLLRILFENKENFGIEAPLFLL